MRNAANGFKNSSYSWTNLSINKNNKSPLQNAGRLGLTNK